MWDAPIVHGPRSQVMLAMTTSIMHLLSGPAATPKTTSTSTRNSLRLGGAIAAIILLGMVAFAQPAGAQSGCTEAGKNVQCTEFGSITMDSQRDIRGDPIDLTATITLNTAFGDHAARWLLFSVRNVTDDGSNPVTISLTHFSTYAGDVVTTRVEHPSANELNLWVDTLDAPVGTPITLDMKIGSTDRGAYRLEVLVMAFDRGYAPVQDSSGADASLFSFTLLGVNKETSGVTADGGGSLLDGHKMPGMEAGAALVAITLVAAVLVRRRQA